MPAARHARAHAAAVAVPGLILLVAACLPEAVRHAGAPSGGSVAVSASPSGPTPVSSYIRPTPTPMPTFLNYVVRRGDSLNSIAWQFETTARSIAFWNRATYPSLDPDSRTYAPNRIEVGWTLLLIPAFVLDEQTLPDPTP